MISSAMDTLHGVTGSPVFSPSGPTLSSSRDWHQFCLVSTLDQGGTEPGMKRGLSRYPGKGLEYTLSHALLPWTCVMFTDALFPSAPGCFCSGFCRCVCLLTLPILIFPRVLQHIWNWRQVTRKTSSMACPVENWHL